MKILNSVRLDSTVNIDPRALRRASDLFSSTDLISVESFA
jgi:hypothetical protein